MLAMAIPFCVQDRLIIEQAFPRALGGGRSPHDMAQIWGFGSMIALCGRIHGEGCPGGKPITDLRVPRSQQRLAVAARARIVERS